MTEKQQTPPEFDPTAFWRQTYEKQMEAWSKFISDATGTEQFAAALGKQLEAYLNAQGVMQKNLQQFMDRSLKNMNIPTRTDVTRLAEQVVALESKVDDLDEKLDHVLDAVARFERALNESARVAGGTTAPSGAAEAEPTATSRAAKARKPAE